MKRGGYNCILTVVIMDRMNINTDEDSCPSFSFFPTSWLESLTSCCCSCFAVRVFYVTVCSLRKFYESASHSPHFGSNNSFEGIRLKHPTTYTLQSPLIIDSNIFRSTYLSCHTDQWHSDKLPAVKHEDLQVIPPTFITSFPLFRCRWVHFVTLITLAINLFMLIRSSMNESPALAF